MGDRIGLSLNIKNLLASVNRRQHGNKTTNFKSIKTHDGTSQGPQRFVFNTKKSIQKQLFKFEALQQLDKWNGHVLFLGFKGTFKLELWGQIEEALRGVYGLTQFTFEDTQLTRPHLTLLKSLIEWVGPIQISLKFKQNELDNRDFEDFLIKGLLQTGGRKIKKFKVVSNPGIFKGHFVSQLKKKLLEMTRTDPIYDFHFIKNKEYHSLGFLRILKEIEPTEKEAMLIKFKKDIQETFYYRLTFSKCFTISNQKAFQHLIENSYHEDKLEQLESLDVGNCILGTQQVFEKMCQKISSSKGLLSLGLYGQVHLTYSGIVQALMGDRYDQLRINHIDIGGCEDMVERATKVLTDNLISKSLKTIAWSGSFGQHLPVLVKLLYFCEAMKNEITLLKGIMKKENYIPKLTLRRLDLSEVDNYNRFDICEAVLNAAILNEFSGCRYLVVQNLDVGRVLIYLSTFTKFEEYISVMKKTNPLYKNFTPKLHTMVMKAQTYRMEEDKMEKLYRQLFFTKSTDLFQINKVVLNFCFNQTIREDGFRLFLNNLKDVYEKEPDIIYTLKHFTMEDTRADADDTFILLFENLVFCKNFQLESLSFLDQSTTDAGFDNFLSTAEIYFKTIPPGSFWSLKKLVFDRLVDTKVDVAKLVELMIFNDKVMLEELILLQFELMNNEQNIISLEEKAEGWMTLLPLKKLHIGGFTTNDHNIEKQLIPALIFNPMSQIIELQLHEVNIKDLLTGFKEQILKSQEQGHRPMNKLKSLTLSGLGDLNEEQWENVADVFIYGQDTTISKFELKTLTISQAFTKGLHTSNAKKIQLQPGKSIQEETFSLKTLIFESCTFEEEIFSLLFASQQKSLDTLHIKKCKQIDSAIKLFKETYESHEEYFDLINFSIHEAVFDETIIESQELFEWFFKKIIMNKKAQQLKILSMKSCKLTDLNIMSINNIIKDLKAFKFTEKVKGYFCLRQINLDQNVDISYKCWKDFFNNLFTVYNNNEEDKLEDVDLEEIEVNLQNQEIQNQEKIELKEQKSEEVVKYVNAKRLSIPQNILANPSQFNITPPVQLTRLEVKVSFVNENDIVKQQLYTRIMKGLVFFPNSQLQELTLSQVDLNMFLQSTEEAIQGAVMYQEICGGQNHNLLPFKIELKSLNLKSISNEGEDLMTKLAQFYFTNPSITLEELILQQAVKGNFYQNLTECIQKRLSEGQFCALKTLKLTSIHSDLNVDQTLTFFRIIVFNEKVPLSVLEMGQDLTIQSEENFFQLINEHIIGLNYVCPLREFVIETKEDQGTLDTIKRLSPLLFEGILVKLNKLHFTISKPTFSLKDLIGGMGEDQKFVNFTINDLQFNHFVAMTLNDFKFFYYVRPKLKKLKLTKLNSRFAEHEEIIKFIEYEEDAIDQIQRYQERCELNISFTCLTEDGNATSELEGECCKLLENFVFGKSLKWDEVTLNGFKHFAFIEHVSFTNSCLLSDTFRHLRYLKLSLDLKFNSSEQMQEAALKVLGDQLIYNERSMLEELCLMQCHLKLPGLKALTSGAQAFRDKIDQSKEQQKISLKLKRFCLYYSLYILNEGAELISREIIFFEYITIEKFELPVLNWNDEMTISQCKSGLAWLKFQKDHNRNQPHFKIKYAEWGRNEFIQSEEAWFLLCDTFLFTDNTPDMEVLNIHFMSMKDQQVIWICQKAQAYFRQKPQDYVYPVKRLNYQLNTALSAWGWKTICDQFFFSEHVNLEELNFISTMLDTDEKLNAIKQAGADRAAKEKTKKLPLHTFLTYNISIKSYFMQFMSPRPIDYPPLKDQPIEIAQCYQNGLIDGVPESFGLQTSIVQKVLYDSKLFIQEKWTEEAKVRFAEYHMDISCGLLKPLSDFFLKHPHYQGHFPIDLAVCDELGTMFTYRKSNGDPYPYLLFFTPEACKYYMTPACKIRVINFIQTSLKNAEQMDQFQVLDLWLQVRSSASSLDVIYIDYKLDDDLVEAMIKRGYNERDIVNLVRLFPPSKMRLQESLTLQALKGIYSIMHDNYQFSYSNMNFDQDIFLNVGISFSLREYIYRTNPTGCLGRFFKPVFYHIFNIFVSSVPKYKFTEQIKDLNNFLSTQTRFFVILILLTIAFYVVCILAPYGWQHFYVGDENFDLICYDGVSNYGLFTYLVFAFFSLIAEAYLFWKVSELIPDHLNGFVEDVQQEGEQQQHQPISNVRQVLPDQGTKSPPQSDEKNTSHRMVLQPKEEEQINLKPPSPGALKDRNNKKKKNKSLIDKFQQMLNILARSRNGRTIIQLLNLGLGQLAKLDFYNDIGFIMTCYYCQFNYLASLAVIVSGYNVLFQLYALTKFILVQCFYDNSKAKLLSTKYINDFFDISTIGRNIALSSLLDSVAPFNVTVISNNFITRRLFPQIAGKSMSNSVKGYLVKFTLEDVPQIFLQLYFVVYRALNPLVDPRTSKGDLNKATTGTLSAGIYATIFITGISLFISFLKQFSIVKVKRFMSIRPSSLSQADYDQLSQRKNEAFLNNQLTFVEKQNEILKAITGEDQKLEQKEKEDKINQEQEDQELIQI